MTGVSRVTVFVFFNLEELPAQLDIRSAALFLSREEPRWSIGAFGSDSVRLGRYDHKPVVVTLSRGTAVLEEAHGFATRLTPTSGRARHSVASSTARFELAWDLLRDRDVSPQTALLVIACAQALARLTHGVVLVEGARIIGNDVEFSFGQAYSALFLPHFEWPTRLAAPTPTLGPETVIQARPAVTSGCSQADAFANLEPGGIPSLVASSAMESPLAPRCCSDESQQCEACQPPICALNFLTTSS